MVRREATDLIHGIVLAVVGFVCLDLNLSSGLGQTDLPGSTLLAVGGGSDPPELYAWPLWQPPLGPTPLLQPEGYDSGAMRKCARWGWLEWGTGVSFPPR